MEWNQSEFKPRCHVGKCLGETGKIETESHRIFRSYDLYEEDYESNIEESLSTEFRNWNISEEELASREDLRSKLTFTIDPSSAKDIDDALSIESISDTLYEVGVHIADVSYFVEEGSQLDKKAALRGTSIYFVHKVYPMLPKVLSNELCSLNPHVDRLTYSIFFRISRETGLLDKSTPPKIARSVIRSSAKLNYD